MRRRRFFGSVPRPRLGTRCFSLHHPEEYCESCVRVPMANCGFAGSQERTAADGRCDLTQIWQSVLRRLVEGRVDNRLHTLRPRSLFDKPQAPLLGGTSKLERFG